MVDSADPARWLKRAALDLRGAKNNLNDDPLELAELVCHESQQACEKALKALFLIKGQAVPRTHDLTTLLQDCLVFDPMMSIFETSMTVLGRYATMARYTDDPGDGEFTAEQAEAAYAMATAVVEYVTRTHNG